MVLSKKIPSYYLIISMLLGGFLPFLIYKFIVAPQSTNAAAVSESLPAIADCNYSLTRLSGYEFIKPLIYADQNCESEIYAPLKAELFNQLQKLKLQGDLTEAGIYVRDLKTGTWMWMGETVKFEGDSFLSLPLLITYLHQTEIKPGMLDEELTYGQVANADNKSQSILQPGNNYKVRQLLLQMSTTSDYAAENLLKRNLDSAAFRKTFTDLGLQPPNSFGNGYGATIHDYAVFMMALYNAGYLTIQNSEYAMAMLSRNTLGMGIKGSLPSGTKVVHISGESHSTQACQLMESAIIYSERNPYLLVVMAKGNEYERLGSVVSSVSGIIYAHNQKGNS